MARPRLRCTLAGLVLAWGPCSAEAPSETEPDEVVAPIESPAQPDVATASDSGDTGQPVPAAAAVPEVVDPWQRGEIGKGDSLSSVLADAGVPASVAARVIAALEAVDVDPTRIRAGERWGVRLADDRSLAEFEYAPTELRTITVRQEADGKWVASASEIETELRTVELHATIDSSLWHAVTGSGGDPALVAMLVDVFASGIDFYTDTRAGDAFAVVVEQHELDGRFVRYGRILAAEYRGTQVGTLRGLWWTPPGREGAYYTPEGGALDRVLLKSPLKFVRVSSKFNPKRMHPVLHRVKGHFGVDYAAPEGTPVWAAADGTIVHRGPQGGAGNLVVLAHDGGLQTLYMHLSRFAKGQEVGDRVRQKTVIGYVGSTGLSTGAHLHFGVKRGRSFVDPATVKSIARPGVPAKSRTEFRAQTKALLGKLEALASP